ncbi:hypothetical protein ABT346_02915 [Micromonospora peucetia]|uniref:hypothetical protein n=1 Tax=Micromonospora peucetia TaxID=47871 RepID=UPI00332BE1E6
MHLVIARLQGGRTLVDRAELHRLIQLVALPGDGLEHVYVMMNPKGAELAFFVLQPTVATAEAVVMQLCRRAIAVSSALHLWLVVHCGSGLVPGSEALLTGDSTDGGRGLPWQDPDTGRC